MEDITKINIRQDSIAKSYNQYHLKTSVDKINNRIQTLAKRINAFSQATAFSVSFSSLTIALSTGYVTRKADACLQDNIVCLLLQRTHESLKEINQLPLSNCSLRNHLMQCLDQVEL